MKLPRFSWKKQVNELEQENLHLQKECLALRNQVDFLIREIRKMDDIIFSIQQSADGSWKTVQPRFQQLTDQMTARKVAESNRINSLIVGELHNTYKPTEPAHKQIGSK